MRNTLFRLIPSLKSVAVAAVCLLLTGAALSGCAGKDAAVNSAAGTETQAGAESGTGSEHTAAGQDDAEWLPEQAGAGQDSVGALQEQAADLEQEISGTEPDGTESAQGQSPDFGSEAAGPGGDAWNPGIIWMDFGSDAPAVIVPLSGEIPQAEGFPTLRADGGIEYIVPEPKVPAEHLSWESCRIVGRQVVLRGRLEGSITPGNTQMGEDTNFYLLELAPYEDSIADHRYVTSLPKNAANLSFTLDLEQNGSYDRLYSRFVACIWDQDHYIAVSDPIYITNPEALAIHREPYAEPETKKGLLVEHSQTEDALELGVSSVLVNIPFKSLFGKGVEYEYEGETYHFDKSVLKIYDSTIAAYSGQGVVVNAVLLNDYNAEMPELLYPGTEKTGNVHYYHFNTATREGYRSIRAAASFLANRYSGGNPSHGRIQNWIIGNEINNQYWNYIGSMDLRRYTHEIERSFRVFYTAIKSVSSNDRVFFSIDHNWMQESDGHLHYNGKDMLDHMAAELARHGDIDWGLAYHPYSVPMTEPEFWDDFRDERITYYEDSPVINFANLRLLTDYMRRDALLDTSGRVRHLILSEAGFTSKSLTHGNVEELQAAAFAYAYYVTDANPYVESFILSRQIDAPSELRQSLSFGLWTTDSLTDRNMLPARKRQIWEVFRGIDRPEDSLEVTAFAKEVLGISRWSDLVAGFRFAYLE